MVRCDFKSGGWQGGDADNLRGEAGTVAAVSIANRGSWDVLGAVAGHA